MHYLRFANIRSRCADGSAGTRHDGKERPHSCPRGDARPPRLEFRVGRLQSESRISHSGLIVAAGRKTQLAGSLLNSQSIETRRPAFFGSVPTGAPGATLILALPTRRDSSAGRVLSPGSLPSDGAIGSEPCRAARLPPIGKWPGGQLPPCKGLSRRRVCPEQRRRQDTR